MVMNRHGTSGFFWIYSTMPRASLPSARSTPVVQRSIFPISHSSGNAGIFHTSTTPKATAMNSNDAANSGYTLPISLSIGRTVATR